MEEGKGWISMVLKISKLPENCEVKIDTGSELDILSQGCHLAVPADPRVPRRIEKQAWPRIAL